MTNWFPCSKLLRLFKPIESMRQRLAEFHTYPGKEHLGGLVRYFTLLAGWRNSRSPRTKKNNKVLLKLFHEGLCFRDFELWGGDFLPTCTFGFRHKTPEVALTFPGIKKIDDGWPDCIYIVRKYNNLSLHQPAPIRNIWVDVCGFAKDPQICFDAASLELWSAWQTFRWCSIPPRRWLLDGPNIIVPAVYVPNKTGKWVNGGFVFHFGTVWICLLSWIHSHLINIMEVSVNSWISCNRIYLKGQHNRQTPEMTRESFRGMLQPFSSETFISLSEQPLHNLGQKDFFHLRAMRIVRLAWISSFRKSPGARLARSKAKHWKSKRE